MSRVFQEAHHYKSLNPAKHEIRLLTLAPGVVDDDIRCDLSIHSLDEELTFETISYVWGDKQQRHHIYLHDVRFDITKALFDVLKALRLLDRPRTLWADGLCIDQLNDEERSSQVLLMSRVYGQCSACQIWLGDEDVSIKPTEPWNRHELVEPGTRTRFEQQIFAMNLFSLPAISDDEWVPGRSYLDVAGALNVVKLLAQDRHIYEWPFYRITGPSDFVYCPRWHRALASFYLIFSSAWFTRVWTVQEAILPVTATLHFGKHELDFELAIQAACNFMKHTVADCECRSIAGRLWYTVLEPKCPIEALESLREIATMREFVRRGGSGDVLDEKPLMHWRLASERNATDPRDHVYGFLGIMPSLVSTSTAALYDKSVEEAYAGATKRVVQGMGLLWFPLISPKRTPHNWPRAQLPSWTIDFTIRGYIPKFSAFTACGEYLRYNQRDDYIAPWDVLPVEIKIVGEITTCLQGPAVEGGLFGARSGTFMTAVERWQSVFPIDERLGGMKDLWRAIFGDISPFTKDHMQESDFPRLDRCLYALMLEQGRDRTLDLEPATEAEIVQCCDWFSNQHRWSNVVLMTDQGRLGTANSVAQQGDLITIAKSSRWPLVIRPCVTAHQTGMDQIAQQGEHYVLVSTCYLDGIMDGEAARNDTPWRFVDLV